jgi:DNA modification methylase
MKISDLQKNPDNPRTITDAKRAMLKKAMLKFGDLSGIIFNKKSKRLVGGHQRQDGLDPNDRIVITKKFSKPTRVGTVAEGFIETKAGAFAYREVWWDDSTEKAANIAANKGAGEWDLEKLGSWMKDLNSFDSDFDLDLTMFDSDELKEFDGITVKEHIRVSATGVDEDDVPEKAPAISKLGDAYILGAHRLLCGDSTDPKAVERLMKGEKACITFTSPPYNLGTNVAMRSYNADEGDESAYNEKTDHKTQDEYLSFLEKWTNLALEHSRHVFCNVQLLAGNKQALPQYWFNLREKLVDVIVWDKEQAAPALASRVLSSVWEFIFIFSSESNVSRAIKTGPKHRGLDNIFRLNPRRGPREDSASTHGAVFPVAFAQHFVENFSDSIVLDPFGGSGSTMIACEKTQRKCFMMEIDPHYCDVIVERWEKYTGLKAKLIRAETVRKPSAMAKGKANGKSKSEAAART